MKSSISNDSRVSNKLVAIHAMTFLGEKLSATWDNPKESFWANKPVAVKMLECAFSQGDGDAAYYLRFEYAPLNTASAEQKIRALKILQEGVKLGSSSCASSLAIDFDGSFDHSKMLAPFLDKARSERYFVLSKALDFSPSRRFPNLDKILPLPPAKLPKWDGKRETLLKAAMAVTPISTKMPSAPVTIHKGRPALDSTFTLQPTGDTTNALHAPFASYWRPTAPKESVEVRAYLASRSPELYATDEEFAVLPYPATVNKYGTIRNVVWERMLTIPSNHAAVAPRTASGLSHEIVPLEPRLSCEPGAPCPSTGTWQPWLPLEHPLRHVVNQAWRQAWVTAGQPLPDPLHDWLLSLDKSELSWHLLDNSPPDLA